MIPRVLIVSALALTLVAPAKAALPTAYVAPAGSRPSGVPNPERPFDLILPDGRIVAPIGTSAVAGSESAGLATTPDGRFVLVASLGSRDTAASSTMSPALDSAARVVVLDAATLRVTDSRPADVSGGITVSTDSAGRSVVFATAADGVKVWCLNETGQLDENCGRWNSGSSPAPGARASGFPVALAAARDASRVYAVNRLANTVSAFGDTASGTPDDTPVGFFPSAAAIAGRSLLVTDEGLTAYTTAAAPTLTPVFDVSAADPMKSSSLAIVPLGTDGGIAGEADFVPLDRVPDGMARIGGAHPNAVAASPDGRFAYVCLGGVDRVVVVDLRGNPHVVSGLDLGFFPGAPLGTQPVAITRSRNGKRLFVALAGINAVAVLDATKPAKLHRLGLIPTGWQPVGVALSADDRVLYVLNRGGIGPDRASTGGGTPRWSTLQRVPLAPLEARRGLQLKRVTLSALRYLRIAQAARPNALVPTLRSRKHSAAIAHVFEILVPGATFDSIFAANATSNVPNLRALAGTFALARNYYAQSRDPVLDSSVALAGASSPFLERFHGLTALRAPLGSNAADPDDLPRAGTIFDALHRAHATYRDYGAGLTLSGFAPSAVPDAARAPMGGTFTLDVRAEAALADHVDTAFALGNPAISAGARADEFVKDFAQFSQATDVPAFTCVSLPGDAPAMAEVDAAVGRIVENISHGPAWSSSAIFIVPMGSGGADAVSPFHTYALVVSPFAKHRYSGGRLLSAASVLKTEEELLGLAPLALGDLLATDMSDFFTARPDVTPYDAAK